jgi:hypothetical protein
MQYRSRPAPMLPKTRKHGIGSASAVNGINAASAVLSGSEDAVEDFELDFCMRSMGRRSIEPNFTDVARFVEQPFQKRYFVVSFVREFWVKAKGRSDVTLSLRKRSRFRPSFRRCRDRQDIDASFLAVRRNLLRIVKEIEMAVEVYQTANPSDARYWLSSSIPRSATST